MTGSGHYARRMSFRIGLELRLEWAEEGFRALAASKSGRTIVFTR
jgi:hypothetical protein